MELPSIEIGKATGKTGLMGMIRRLHVATLILRYLLDVQVELLDRGLNYRSLGLRSDIGKEIKT